MEGNTEKLQEAQLRERECVCAFVSDKKILKQYFPLSHSAIFSSGKFFLNVLVTTL